MPEKKYVSPFSEPDFELDFRLSGEKIRQHSLPGLFEPDDGLVQIRDAGRQIAGEAIPGIPKKRRLPAQRKKIHRIRWIPSSETVTIAGRNIGGMVYTGTHSRSKSYRHYHKEQWRFLIDPDLPVSKYGDNGIDNSMLSWSGYSGISPQSRATYLDWLQSGRSDSSCNPGFMLMYFHGLERRFIMDQPDENEKREILRETERLKTLYPDNNTVQLYLEEFIAFARILLKDKIIYEPVFEGRGYDIPLSVKIAIGECLARGERISADWTLSWLMCHQERRLRTPATRCFEEFRALFKLRFNEFLPDGMYVRTMSDMLEYTYSPATDEFSKHFEPKLNNGKMIPDITHLTNPVLVAQKIADDVMAELAGYSRFLGRNPDKKGSIEAQSLLPPELSQLFSGEELRKIKTLARKTINAGGLISIRDLIGKINGEKPEKPNKAMLSRVSFVLAQAGYGLVPDSQYDLRGPKPDESVILFKSGKIDKQVKQTSDEYRNILLRIAFGAYAAHADGKITKNEKTTLMHEIKSVELSVQESRRLVANLNLMFLIPPSPALLYRRLKDVKQNEMIAIRSTLISVARANGQPGREKIAAIEKIYKAMNLDENLVYSDTHAGKINRIQAHGTSAASGFTLDSALIAARQSQTRDVSELLDDIFDDSQEQSETVVPDDSIPNGLNARHWNLVQNIITREHWTQEAFEQICQNAGLPVSGAVEAINEWSFDVHEEALLEEYNGFEVSPDSVKQIKLNLERKEDISYDEP